MSSKRSIQPTDDRGSPCELQVSSLPKKPPKNIRKLENEISLGNSQNMHWSVFFGFVLLAVGPLLILVVIQTVSSRPVLPNWYWHATMLAIGLLIAGSFRWVPFVANSRARETNRRAIDAWAEAGLCPTCGHDFALDLEKNELTPNEDGCAICPQCHAAWQTERFAPAMQAHSRDWRRQWEESQQSSQPDAAR